MTRYRTIVADPPWAYRETRATDATSPANPVCATCNGCKYRGRPGLVCRCEQPNWLPYVANGSPMPYPTMTLREIGDLPIPDLADPTGAHLYLWTTQRFLFPAFNLMHNWGFKQSAVLVWSKPPMGLGKPFVVSAEFVLVGRRGAMSFTGSHMGTVFEWPRKGGHSAKPEAFLDLIERMSPGPYLEMFARRARFGWDYYGDQSLGTAEAVA